MMRQQPIEYPFPTNSAATSYLIFPPELEDDEHVFFHGTADAVRNSILTGGFRIPAPPRAQSVSFAKTSSLSSRYASEAHSEVSPNGCIFVVRYEDLTRGGLNIGVSILHDYTLHRPRLSSAIASSRPTTSISSGHARPDSCG